jgi:hypothetical protein
LQKPEKHEIGLLLLLLKDLWTGDLPIGGESSIGRGRLQGIDAKIYYEGNTWQIQGKEKLEFIPKSIQEKLESYIQELLQKIEVNQA